MPTLRISIYGIACLVDARKNASGQRIDPFEKRVLLPTDTIFDDSNPPHVPFVEIAELDLFNQPGTIPGLSDRYTRNNIAYRRFELYGQRLYVENVDTTQGWSVSSSLYDYRIIKMKEVLPWLDDRPRDECFDVDPSPELISGYFDISYGHLSIGNLDSMYTSFTKNTSWKRRRLAVASTLEIEVTGTLPMLRIEDVNQNQGTGTLVRLNSDTAGISIGNLPKDNLEGRERDNFTHDFWIFYKLARQEPVDPPLPTRPGGLQISCSNTNWP
jgi:hypothetical protein